MRIVLQAGALKLCFLVMVMGAMSMQVAERIGALEAELRRSKRREEKLAALQYRLREDLKQNQGDIRWNSSLRLVSLSRCLA